MLQSRRPCERSWREDIRGLGRDKVLLLRQRGVVWICYFSAIKKALILTQLLNQTKRPDPFDFLHRSCYPIGGKRRILRRCVSTESKSDGTRPTRPLCKLQDGAPALSYAKINSTSEGPCSQGCTHVSFGFCGQSPLQAATCVCGVSLATTMLALKAPNRSIHLEPLPDLKHISKPELK